MKRLCAVLVCVLCLQFPTRAMAQASPGTITTFAGAGTAGFSGDGGPAAQAQFNAPTDVAVDGSGNVYVADPTNNVVRKISASGIITTFAGGGAGQPGSGSGGPATQAVLVGPSHVAVDASGNVYISDPGGQRVVRVGTDGILKTIAGGTSLVGGFGGDGGAATQAKFNFPRGLAVDGSGNVYILDQLNNRIRKVDASGVISTFAGTGTGGFSGDGGAATQAQLRLGAGGLAVDGSGNLYIADQLNNRIRKVDTGGIITTVAGGGSNTADGIPATQARITFVSGVAAGPDGSLFITDVASVRKVGADGTISTVVGTGSAGFGGDGGPATKSQVSRPGAVALDAKGNLYIADTKNNRIRRVEGAAPAAGASGASIALSVSSLEFDTTQVGTASQKTFTISNSGTGSLSVTGITVTGTNGTEFRVSPTTATVAAGGTQTVAVAFVPASAGAKSATLSVAHNASGGPSPVALKGIGEKGPTIRTVAGRGPGFSGDGGAATQAQFNRPTAVAADAKGNVYIVDQGNHRVRRVGGDGVITTLAGTGAAGFAGDGGQAAQAQLNSPSGVAVDASGNIYIADQFNSRVRRVGTDGAITTFAGTGMNTFSGDGGPATQAALFYPLGVAVDAKGNVYIADTNNGRIRRVGPDGTITTIAGNGDANFTGDGGQATQASFSSPSGVAVDANGVLYVADLNNGRIRRVGPDGIITTFAGGGSPPSGSNGDGGPATQASIQARGVAVDAAGAVYIVEQNKDRIRRVGANGIITTFAGGGFGEEGSIGDGGPATQAQLSRPSGVAVDASGAVYIADTNNSRIRRVDPLTRVAAPAAGQVGTPSINLSASSLTFDNTNVGATSQKTLTISNTGNASLSVTGVTVTGTDAAQFKVSPTSGSVEVGKSLTVTVTFAPTAVGVKTVSLSIAHNATGSPAAVSLTGMGVAATTTPSAGLTPKAGDGTGVLDLDVAAGDQNSRTAGGVKPGQQVNVQVILNKEIANATGFQVILTFDPKKLKVASGKGDGVFASAIFPGPPQVKDSTATYAGSFLGQTVTAKGPVAVLTFETLGDYTGDTEIVLTSLAARVSGAFITQTPGASVVLSAGAVGLASDFDGDGTVDFNDFFLFAGAFGQRGTGENKKFDLDGDGEIGFGDFFLFAGEFGKKR